jgi:hypothetical protein
LSFKYKVFIGVIGIMARTLQVESINSSSTGLDLQTLSASRLFINNSGNVGIGLGAVSPLSPLHIGFSNTALPTTGSGSIIQLTNTDLTTSSTSSIIFAGYDAGGTSRHGAAISWIKTGSWTSGGNNYGSALIFSTRVDAGNTVECFRITSSGGISFGATGTAFGTSGQVLISAGNLPPSWGLIANANVSASAAIAYSKLNLASSITSSDIVDGTIVNADISASAAIAYSKLNLASSITSSDIVDGTIVNGDISASAAIAYSKLSLGTSIVNSDISAGAAIVDTKLATISTAGKVSNSATTATSANTASAIVARDASNNFSAGTITANLTGTASTASALTTGNNYRVNSLGVGIDASGSAGEIRALGNITAYYGLSDKRLKENITPLKNVLKKLENINGYNFNYKTRPNQKMVGVIAQELLEEFPELIYETAPIDETSGLDKAYAVRYELLTSILLQAIKELSSEVNKLKNNK